jgi:hypothetical protein
VSEQASYQVPGLNPEVPHSAGIIHAARQKLDFDQPIAVTLLGVQHFILDDVEARTVVRRLVDALSTGSYLAIAVACNDINRAQSDDIVTYWNEHGTPKIVYRSSAELERSFEGLELLEPGVVPCSRWRPGPDDPDIDVNQYCGVASQ